MEQSPAPVTPLGSRTPHAHPGLYVVIAILSLIIIAGAYWVFATYDVFPDQTPTPAPEASTAPNEIPVSSPVDGTPQNESLRFSSAHFTLSFDAPINFEVADSWSRIAVSNGPYRTHAIGSDTAFLTINRYGEHTTKASEMARFRQSSSDITERTVLIDGVPFKRMDGIDSGSFEGESAGHVFAIFFDKSVLWAIERPRTDQATDYRAAAENIVASLRFVRTTHPAGPFALSERTEFAERYTGTAQLSGTYSQGNDGMLGDIVCFEPTWPSRDLLPGTGSYFCFGEEAAAILKLGDKKSCSYRGTATIRIRDFAIPAIGGEVVNTTTLVSAEDIEPYEDLCW